jgi:hypothetical protein
LAISLYLRSMDLGICEVVPMGMAFDQCFDLGPYDRGLSRTYT